MNITNQLFGVLNHVFKQFLLAFSDQLFLILIIKERWVQVIFMFYEKNTQYIFYKTFVCFSLKIQVLKLSDGGEVCLDWTNPTSVNEKSPICLFLPGYIHIIKFFKLIMNCNLLFIFMFVGLTGDSQSEYIKSFVNIGRRNLGARCVVFNFRGRGGHVLKTPRTYVSQFFLIILLSD